MNARNLCYSFENGIGHAAQPENFVVIEPEGARVGPHQQGSPAMLVLQITSEQRDQPGIAASYTFDEKGGSIGRAADNDWVLPDPEKYVSSCHAEILCRDGGFTITDTSLNGISLNGERLQRSVATALSDGDRVGIGDYQIAVSLGRRSGVETASEMPASLGFRSPSKFEPEELVETDSWSPDRILDEPQGPLLKDDPFADLEPESKQPTPKSDILEQRDPLHESYTLPKRESRIPDNWWEDETAQPSAAPVAQAPQVATKPVDVTAVPTQPSPVPVDQPPQVAAKPLDVAPMPPQPAVPMRPSDTNNAVAVFAEAAGLPLTDLSQHQQEELMRRAGGLLRQMVGGTMDVLAARASLKSEARLHMTTIQPVDNNPLKFSFNVDDGLRRLLIEPTAPGYLDPHEAVDEALQDIKAHQIATFAGLEAALKALFRQFDPARVEDDVSGQGLVGSLMPAHRKAKCWDRFREVFEDLTEQVEEDAEKLFGEEFTRAYEEQIRKVKSGILPGRR